MWFMNCHKSLCCRFVTLPSQLTSRFNAPEVNAKENFSQKILKTVSTTIFRNNSEAFDTTLLVVSTVYTVHSFLSVSLFLRSSFSHHFSNFAVIVLVALDVI